MMVTSNFQGQRRGEGRAQQQGAVSITYLSPMALTLRLHKSKPQKNYPLRLFSGRKTIEGREKRRVHSQSFYVSLQSPLFPLYSSLLPPVSACSFLPFFRFCPHFPADVLINTKRPKSLLEWMRINDLALSSSADCAQRSYFVHL